MISLADAIRKGAAETTKCKGEYVVVRYPGETHEPQYEACALGAAAIGLGFHKLTGGHITKELQRLCPELDEVITECPACRYKDTLYRIITHLNDLHDWERASVADWLDEQTLDLSLDVTPTAPADVWNPLTSTYEPAV